MKFLESKITTVSKSKGLYDALYEDSCTSSGCTRRTLNGSLDLIVGYFDIRAGEYEDGRLTGGRGGAG